MKNATVWGSKIAVNVSDSDLWRSWNKEKRKKVDCFISEAEKLLNELIRKFIKENLTIPILKKAICLNDLCIDGNWHEVAVGAGKTEIRWTTGNSYQVRRTTNGGTIVVQEADLYGLRNLPQGFNVVALGDCEKLLEKVLRAKIRDVITKLYFHKGEPHVL